MEGRSNRHLNRQTKQSRGLFYYFLLMCYRFAARDTHALFLLVFTAVKLGESFGAFLYQGDFPFFSTLLWNSSVQKIYVTFYSTPVLAPDILIRCCYRYCMYTVLDVEIKESFWYPFFAFAFAISRKKSQN